MALILPRRNLLSYPAGVTPGFDPSHPASNGTVVSAVPVGGNFVNLLTGKLGILGNTPTAYTGTAGPGTKFLTNSNVSFPTPTVTPTSMTMAAIFEIDSASGNATSQIIATHATAGQQISFNNPLNFGYAFNNGAFISALFGGGFVAPLPGVSYFYAVSISATAANCVLVRLDTGAMVTIVQSGGTFTTTDGNLYIGNRGLNTRHLNGAVHAAYYNPNQALTLAQLTSWAKDPWSFWYPDQSPKRSINPLIIPNPVGGAVAIRRRPTKNLLSYPSSPPGFDPTHPASMGCLFSGIGEHGVFTNILTNTIGTKNGSPTHSIHGRLGSTTNYTAGTDNTQFPFTAAVFSGVTIAGIFSLDTITGNSTQQVLATGAGGSNGNNMNYSSGTLQSLMGLTQVISSLSMIAGGTYFAAVSQISTVGVQFLLKNLATGAVVTEFITNGAAMTAGDGLLYVGNRGTNSRQLGGRLACASFTPRALTKQQLLQWAQDPWAFWYPRDFDKVYSPAPSPVIAYRAKKGFNQSLFAFPAGATPGFDPAHPLSSKPVLSVVANNGGNCLNLLTGKTGDPANSFYGSFPPTFKMHRSLGPVSDTSGFKQCTAFTNCPINTAVDAAFSCAWIGTIQTTGGAYACFDSSNDSGYKLGSNNTGFVSFTKGLVVEVVSSIPFLANVPYFIAASISAGHGTIKFVVVRLDTGQMWTDTKTNVQSSLAPATTYAIGNTQYSAGAQNGIGLTAAVYISNADASLAQLIAAAKDPWSLWYPEKVSSVWFDPTTIVTGNVFTKTIAAASAATTAWLKSTGKQIAVASTGATSVLKSVAKKITVASAGAVSLIKAIARTVSISTHYIVKWPLGSNDQWSPSFVDARSFTFSNLYKTASTTGAFKTLYSVLAQNTTGKYYFELTLTALASGPFITINNFDSSEYILLQSTNNYLSSGNIPGGDTAIGGTWASGDIIGIAVDFAANKMWVRKNGGLWDSSGTADPVTNTNGITNVFPTGNGPYYIGYISGSSGTNTVALNTGSAAFANTIPSGFVPWYSAGVLFNQAVNAASAGAVSVKKAVGKIVSVTSTGTTSLLKSVGKSVAVASSGAVSSIKSIAKTISVASAGAVSNIKSVGKKISATAVGTTTATAIRVILVTIAAACTGTVSRLKSVGKIVVVTTGGAVSAIRGIGKSIAATSTGTASFIKSIGKTIAASSLGTAIVSAIKSGAGLFFVTVSATSSGSVTLKRAVGKGVLVASTGTVSTVKAITRTVLAACAGAVATIKTVSKTVLATCSGAVTATAIKVKIVIISAASTGSVTLKRAVGKGVLVASSGSVALVKAITRTLSVTATGSVSFVKSIGKKVLAACAGIASAVAHVGATVYSITINVASTTFVQWLVRKFTNRHHVALPRTGHQVATPRTGHKVASPHGSGWPAAPREI